MKKAKTAVGRVTEQQKTQERLIRTRTEKLIAREQKKIVDKYENKIARLFNSKKSENKKDQQRQFLFKDMQREIEKKNNEINALHNIKIHNAKRIKETRQAEVKRVAKIIAKSEDKKYSDVIKSAPKTLEHLGYNRRQFIAPSRAHFKRIFDQKRYGRGLDYYIPFGYEYYRNLILKARKEAGHMLYGYIMHAHFSYTVDGEHRDRYIPLSDNSISSKKLLGPKEYEDQIRKAAKTMVEEYDAENIRILDLMVHFTVNIDAEEQTQWRTKK